MKHERKILKTWERGCLLCFIAFYFMVVAVTLNQTIESDEAGDGWVKIEESEKGSKCH